MSSFNKAMKDAINLVKKHQNETQAILLALMAAAASAGFAVESNEEENVSDLDEYIGVRWAVNESGQVIESSGYIDATDPDHPIINIKFVDGKPEITD